MNIKKHTQEMYNKFGKEYQKTRDERRPERLFNECYELPSIFRAIGNVSGKTILDLGCGAGKHSKYFLKKGAKVCGLDISKTMIEIAREECPSIDFRVGSMEKIPFNKKFDIVSASLCIHYIDNLKPVFKEVSNHLKKGGLFYFTTDSPQTFSLERKKLGKYNLNAFGYVKINGKKTTLGNIKKTIVEWDMVPGMRIKSYMRPLREYLKAFQESGMELMDVIDCEPNAAFKKQDPVAYNNVKKVPVFSVYVVRKK